jgi:phage terminase small subunit
VETAAFSDGSFFGVVTGPQNWLGNPGQFPRSENAAHRSPNPGSRAHDQLMPRRPTADLDFPPPKLVEPALPISLPAAPPHLSDEMKNFWRTTVADYELEAHHLHVLLCACDAFDRMTEAREAVRRDGIVVQGTRGPRPHPCLGVERDNKALFARLIRELDLDEPTPSPGAYMRPPSLRSNRRR